MAGACVWEAVRKSQMWLPVELSLGKGQSEQEVRLWMVQCAHLHQLKWSGLWPEAMLALQTHHLALLKMLQHLELVLLWDFWISILNGCACVGDFASIWSHVFYAHIVQSCKHKTEGKSCISSFVAKLMGFIWKIRGFSPTFFFLLCETDVLLHTQTFGGRNVFLLKAIRMRCSAYVGNLG